MAKAMTEGMQEAPTPEELLRTFNLTYDMRMGDNRLHTFELETLPDDIKKAIKQHMVNKHNRHIHLSTSDDPYGVNHLPINSEVLTFFDGIKAKEIRIADADKASAEAYRQSQAQTSSQHNKSA